MTSGMTSGPINSFALAAKHFVVIRRATKSTRASRRAGEVAVIDTATLTKQTLSVGSAPEGMSVSSDGTTLSTRLSGEKAIGVIDLYNSSVLPKLPIAFEPRDIEAGLDDRLYIAPVDYNGDLIQVDATTGMTRERPWQLLREWVSRNQPGPDVALFRRYGNLPRFPLQIRCSYIRPRAGSNE